MYTVDPDDAAVKSCDLYKTGCTFAASTTTKKYKWYNAYAIPDSGADSNIAAQEGAANGDKFEFTVSDVATVRSFDIKLGYEFKGPKLIQQRVYCI